MKTKIFKLLSVVMALAMVFSMFACVAHAEETPAYVVADTVEAGVAYKLGMIQEKVSATDVYYINGSMSTYYMATVTDPAAALDVYLEAVEGGYNLSTTVNGAKKYINMVVSGTHVNGVYEDAASTVYTFDETRKILVSTVNDKEYAIGTRNDKTYTTVGPVATSYNGFHCQLYVAPKAEEPVPEDVVEAGVLTPAMGKGTVNGVDMTASNSINTDSPRLYALNVYKVADYDEAIVAADCRIYVHFFKEDGKWLGGSGWLATGTHKLATLGNAAGADVFRVTLSSTAGGNDAQTPPADGLKFTLADTIVDGVVTPVMAKGTVNGVDMTASNSINTDSPRLYAAKVYKVADFDEAIVAADCRIYVHFFKEDGKWLGGSGWLATGTHKLSTLSYAGGADVFRVTLSSTAGGNDAQTPPADGLKLTVKTEEPDYTPLEGDTCVDGIISPKLASGTVNGAPKTLDTCVAPHDIRLYTVNTYVAAEIGEIIVGEGCRVFVQFWKEDGTYNEGSGWKFAGTYKVADLAGYAGAKFFKITFDSADGTTTPPVEGLKFTVNTATEEPEQPPVEPEVPEEPKEEEVPIGTPKYEVREGDVYNTEDGYLYPAMGSGTVNGDPKTLENCVAEHATRLYTINTYPVEEVTTVIVAEGCRAFIQYWNEDGTYNSGAGWLEPGKHKVKEGPAFLKITFSSTVGGNDAATPPADGLKFLVPLAAPEFPLEEGDTIDGGIVSPLLASGTVNGAPKTLDTCVAEHATRLYTVNTYKSADYLNIIVPEGTRAFVQYWNEDGSYNSGDGWLNPGTHKVKANAPLFKITYSGTVGGNDAVTPPADGLKLVAKMPSAPHDCEVKEYTSNNDATCLEDGTKSGVCVICGETITVKDEFSAKGHTFAEGEDKCSVCGESRPTTDNCEHSYGEYVSNGDAKCGIDGTKTATCLKCGNVDTVLDEGSALKHKVDFVENNDAGCENNGTKSGVCELCGETITEEIPGSALGHKFGSEDDDYCTVCGFERTRLVYYVYEGRLGGVDANDGLTAETPVATIENAIKLALEKGAGIGDIVELKISGTVAWGGTVDGNWENIVEYGFKLILSAQDSTATVGDGQKNIILGGAVVYDGVILNAGNNWRAFCANGKDFTFGKGFASDMFDLALGNRKNIDVNKDVTYNFDAFFPKIWVGNNYNSVNYNKKFTLNLNGNLRADGSEDTRNFTLVLGAGENGKTNFNGIATITNNTNNGLTFRDGGKVIVGENGAFILVNKNADLPVSITEIGLTDEAVAKTWVLNVAAMATIDPTDVAGEFDVAMGYIASATSVDGQVVKSSGGKLVIPAGEYTISFEICQAHAYDNDYDPDCNVCGAVREVEEPDCVHEWGEFEALADPDCENNATEIRTCALCGETETREVPDTMLGHNYDDNGFCTVCGIYEVLDPTLVKVDGVWYYLEDGVKTNKTTLVKYSGKWFYLENGIWDAKITNTLVKYEGKWFYIKGGKWDSKVEDLVKYEGKWFYIKSGKWNSSSKTLFKKNGSWFYINKGKWDSSAKCIFKFNGKDFYISGGKWKSTTTTLFKKDGKYYAIKSGKWYKGKNIIKYNGKKYYVNKGYAQTKYSGKVTISGKKYTVKKGIIK